jgi:hypothetical protein
MNIELIGRVVLIVIGGFIVISVALPKLIFPKVQEVQPPNFWTLALAVLCMGVGTFGLVFLQDYTSWFKDVKDMVNNPGVKSYATFFDSVGKGKIPVEVQEIGLNYAVTHPVEGMENILNDSISETPKNTPRDKALQGALESYKGREKEIDYLIETKVRPALVKQFNPTTTQFFLDRVQRLPNDRKQALGIDDKSLQAYKRELKE